GNTNAAFAMARGEYVLLSDHDDILEKDALYEIVSLLNREPDLDIVYTDEDLTDEAGEHFRSPRFKPDFNLDLLRSINYICHLFCVRRSVLDAAGGLHDEYDGAQDWDLFLRCSEQTDRIGHVARVLYHWRESESSTARNPESKTYAIDAARRALEGHYQRMGLAAELHYTDIFIMYQAKLTVRDEAHGMVSILIPNKDNRDVLRTCVESILEKSSYRRFEILVIENNSTEPETFAYYKELEQIPEVRVIRFNEPFNYAKVNNFGAAHAKGDYLLLLNNDTEVISPDWLEQLLGHCQRPDVGAAGAKLLYPDETVQHCGVVTGVGGFAGHILTGKLREDAGYMGRLLAVQDVSAVTGACLMIKKSLFDAVGGLDEALTVALNDIDLCLKVRETGALIVLNPAAELFHYESKSRGYEETPEKHERFKREIRYFREKWKHVLEEGDPYYNPNLSLMYGDCRLRGEEEYFEIVNEIEEDIRKEQQIAEQSETAES
ncbi:MAG: glycosyltransferase family 2 protein, partial [Eubacterium sp.]|nr:glycosyltransferase family 2 protein [Eubacterium sp.]